jgi:signal transduction histidine kinase
MTTLWIVGIIGLLLLVPIAMLVSSYAKLRKQNLLIRLQSQEIERQIRELMSQNQSGEQLLHEKRQLVMLVSHDPKGPFNRLYALMQLFEMGANNLTADQKEYLGKMYQIVADGLNMVRNLVEIRKLEERGLEPHPELADVASVVAGIVNQYRVSAGKKSIKIHLDAPNIEFAIDQNYLSRILENLLSNAIKFSPNERDVFVTLKVKEKNLEIVVRDTGPGISSSDQLQLYQRFHRLTARPTGGETSTGLGLSIVKQLVTNMGGTIECKSELEKGSTFIVSLPEMPIRNAPAANQEKIQLKR